MAETRQWWEEVQWTGKQGAFAGAKSQGHCCEGLRNDFPMSHPPPPTQTPLHLCFFCRNAGPVSRVNFMPHMRPAAEGQVSTADTPNRKRDKEKLEREWMLPEFGTQVRSPLTLALSLQTSCPPFCVASVGAYALVWGRTETCAPKEDPMDGQWVKSAPLQPHDPILV